MDSVGYVVLEAYQSLDIIALELDDFKAFAGDIKRLYNLDIDCQPLNIRNGGTDQGRYLKARIPELILVNYSGRRIFPYSRCTSYILPCGNGDYIKIS